MTFVSGRVARSIGFATFADLTGPNIHLVPPVTTDGITFDGALSDAQVTAIRARMTSRDDADQAQRADLATKRDAVIADPTLANIAALVVANTNYVLGDVS